MNTLLTYLIYHYFIMTESASATLAISEPLAGLKVSKVLPLLAFTKSLLMNSLVSTFGFLFGFVLEIRFKCLLRIFR